MNCFVDYFWDIFNRLVSQRRFQTVNHQLSMNLVQVNFVELLTKKGLIYNQNLLRFINQIKVFDQPKLTFQLQKNVKQPQLERNVATTSEKNVQEILKQFLNHALVPGYIQIETEVRQKIVPEIPQHLQQDFDLGLTQLEGELVNFYTEQPSQAAQLLKTPVMPTVYTQLVHNGYGSYAGQVADNRRYMLSSQTPKG